MNILKRFIKKIRKDKPKQITYLNNFSSNGTKWAGRWPISIAELPNGVEWAKTAETMLKTDAKIKSFATSLFNAILSATFYIEEGDNTQESKRNAEFIRSALGLDGFHSHLNDSSFESIIARIVDFLLIGFHTCEEIYRLENGYLWLDSLVDVDPASIVGWERNEYEIVTSFDQLTTDYKRVKVPLIRCQKYVLSQRGDDPTGQGILVPCFKWFKAKEILIDLLIEGHQRGSLPIPVMKPNRSLLVEGSYEPDAIEQMREKAEEALNAYSEGELTWLLCPNGMDASFAGGNFSSSDIRASIDLCNQEMASAFLENFAEIGVSESGNRSIGEIHYHAFKASIGNYLDLICNVWNGLSREGGGTIARLLGANFYRPYGDKDLFEGGKHIPKNKLPLLKHRGVNNEALLDMLSMLPQLVTGGILSPDDELEAKIRDVIGLKERGPERDWDQRLNSVKLGDLQSLTEVTQSKDE